MIRRAATAAAATTLAFASAFLGAGCIPAGTFRPMTPLKGARDPVDAIVAVNRGRDPQLLVRKFEAMAADVSTASDCSSLVEARGGRVKVVDGDPRLVKVTDESDLQRAAALL